MELYERAKKVDSKNGLINFLNLLIKDYEENPIEWENKRIDEYLEAMKSWIEDMEGFYNNNSLTVPHNINWSFLAHILGVGKIYE